MHHTDHIIPNEPRQLPSDGALYFVGIGGAGMSAIAQVLAERGRTIRGADPGVSATVKARLEAVGATIYAGHDGANVGADVSAVVVSDAIPQANPEVLAAKERGIPVYRRPEVLGAIVNAGRGIAIAGTHGKTTTTGMVASILMAANLDPTVLIGGDLPLIGGNARNGNGEFVVAESCEAYDGFLYLHPEVAVILNIEADHLDYHGTEQHVFDSFERFIAQIQENGYLIGCADDAKTRKTMLRMAERYSHYDGTMEGYAYSTQTPKYLENAIRQESQHAEAEVEMVQNFLAHADNIVVNGSGTSFDVCAWDGDKSESLMRINLKVPGIHNVSNALAAICAVWALEHEIEEQYIVSGLESFTGTGRRFERLGEVGGVTVVDDYAHHPTELRATLSAARSAFPGRRIVAVFQPHLPSRTRDLMGEFAEALAYGGSIALTPPAPLSLRRERGENTTEGVTFAGDSPLPDLPPLPSEGEGGRGGEGYDAGIAVYLTDIYLAREQPIPGVSSETLAKQIAALPDAPPVVYVPDKSDLPARLAAEVRPGDVVITLGAGDIRAAGEGLLKLLSAQK